MASQKNKLAKHKELLPNRARLCMEAMFGVTEAERNAAQALLDALPKEVRTRDEEVAWTTECWMTTRLPCDEDLAKSPIGRATLAMLKDSKPMTGEIPAEAMAALEMLRNSEPEPAAANPPAPGEPAETPNEFAEQLANWPPKSSPQPKAPVEDEQPRLWVAGTPSKPDKSLRPISDSDFDSNKPIY